ncbi:hypothetical protein Ahy_B03g068234 isoform C [Arachis hypogaea]|uniref:Uncharacterized protein n=1 Tax=Arachis hypogaea TaxID=3818 RepID=A0A445A960_ARAHY|nr:hypothetical protein Ahy_B03g068234 isoform C [Arachis hypogaea]
MATSLFRSIRRASSLLKFSYSTTSFSVSPRSVVRSRISVFLPFRQCNSVGKPSSWWGFRELSYGTVNLVISEGKTKFEAREVEPPRKDKYKTKKKLKMQRKREKEKRKAANRRDPRWLGVKGKKKQKFANAEERIKCKLEKVSTVIGFFLATIGARKRAKLSVAYMCILRLMSADTRYDRIKNE